jgi:dTDP-4-dehydrorhamnose reductase
MTKVLVLGGRGMIGAGVVNALEAAGVQVLKTSRQPQDAKTVKFEAGQDSIDKLLSGLEAGDYVFNGIGLIKQRIDERSIDDRRKAIAFNADFPHRLAEAAEARGIRVIQVATDCVYEGTLGNYAESAKHDASDVYGKTKSLGEVPSPAVMHLRCSVIGPETGASLSLFEWVRSQPENAKLTGYTDHLWNGVTSEAFGRIIVGIVTEGQFLAGLQHLVTASVVSKANLVRAIAARCGRGDIKVIDATTTKPVDRTLITERPERNAALWTAAGYTTIPSVEKLVAEMSIG